MFKAKINPSLILHFLSIVISFESLFMFLAVFVSALNHETITEKLLLASVFAFLLGLSLNILTKNQRHSEPSRKESFFIVSISWFMLGLIGTIPYLVTGTIPNFVNAFFESISGFTTTGSSILADIESLPKSILFWRAETHWIGGMGIIVLVVAVMPFLNINGIYLFYSEISSVTDEKISTKIRYAARNMWLVYIGLTFIEIVFLLIGKMSLFDSVCHAFATVATGGFSTKNDSIAGFSPYIQYIITLFMLLSGINFSLHVILLKGKFRTFIKNEELRLYLFIILVVGATITGLLYFEQHLKLEQAFRDSVFQVVSVLTATGFATADYLKWPEQATLLIALLMLIGASSGSTGGGVKVIRHLISLKKIRHSFKTLIKPNVVNVIRYNGSAVQSEYISGVLAFVILYYLILMVSTLIMMSFGQDAATSFGASATCMGGIGPGFGTVGPVSNFLHLPDGAKYFLTLLMVIGRLEIYSVLIIFTRTFWRL
ncbi:TrkH family potassium uptake protein [Maribellus maritimus]|uniref:TrkH family potassium uptake protein n=1 Tax=Maribellus maritimus TaxID=2870838 RepID=UPI001EEA1A4C|nr:TrkH family potassium uptake protein [Maribellus maritimus]MCG6188697.1 TrkH family potassium uptake protein [Maribellus maritimus]